MASIFDVFLLSVGLSMLWYGTLLTVQGAVALADRYGFSHGFVGLAVLAIGTDLPELVVALSGSWQQLQGIEASGVIVGSALGSTMAQGTLVLGVAGLFGYLPVAPRMVKRDGLTLLVSIGLATLVLIDGTVTRGEGGLLILAYLMYFIALYQSEKGQTGTTEELGEGRLPPPAAIVVGMLIVMAGAHLVVTSAIDLADLFGLSQTILGALIVGIGTSLPELALSVRAAMERHASLSVGNVIGSNIFDMLIPIGAGAAIYPLTVDRTSITLDIPALAVGMPLLLFFLIRRRGLQRDEAAILIAVYVAYVAIRVTTA